MYIFSRFSLVFVILDGYTWMGDRSRNTGMMIVLYFVQAGGKQTARLNKQPPRVHQGVCLARMFDLLVILF